MSAGGTARPFDQGKSRSLTPRARSMQLFGYPECVFPPTDFHTATLIDESIYIIGSLGYAGQRAYGRTPIYRLDTRTWRIDRFEAKGQEPGWIHSHRAIRLSGSEIRVTGGEVLTQEAGAECSSPNLESFVLDTVRRVWKPQPE